MVEYLGRYTHKIAISNHRIRNIDAEHRLWVVISMLATNAEISASATTPAETVIAQNVREKTEKNGLRIGKPNCFPYLISTWFLRFRII